MKSCIVCCYQGQYEDEETGAYYNRHRYYDPDMGMYISQDPIGLEGGSPNIYAYTHDVNGWVDPFGLDCQKATKVNFKPDKKFVYRRGGEMSVLKHILKRHRASTLYDEVSKFGTDSTKKIQKLIKEAVESGEVDNVTKSITKTFTRDIGTDVDGNITKTIKVFFDDKGWVKTAFPI